MQSLHLRNADVSALKPPNICEAGLSAEQTITVPRNILFSPSMSNSTPDCFNEHMMQAENYNN